MAALKSEWQAAKAQREEAERRVAEIEGIERDLAADRAEVEALRETWRSWSATLAQTQDAPEGSVTAEAQAQARQILKKVLVGPSSSRRISHGSGGMRRRLACSKAYAISINLGSLHAPPAKLTPNGAGRASKPSGKGGDGTLRTIPNGTITVG